MTYTVATYRERPDLIEASQALNVLAWPEFMLHDPVANEHWDRLATDFPDYQFMLLDETQRVVCTGNSIPFVWDGRDETLSDDGWDWVMRLGMDGFQRGNTPTAMSALSITVHPDYLGQGLSYEAVNGMREVALRQGFRDLVAPVRPNKKHLYPLTPVDRYVTWMREDGAPFDAWMRVHWKLGARIVKPCPYSMLIENTVATWEHWTGMPFPETGDYIVPGALVPVRIDREQDRGRYVEPNVWMHHRVAP